VSAGNSLLDYGVERPDGECASRQRSEVTDSCFLAELRWRRGHRAA